MPNGFSKFHNEEVVGRRPKKMPGNSSAGTGRKSVPALPADFQKWDAKLTARACFLTKKQMQVHILEASNKNARSPICNCFSICARCLHDRTYEKHSLDRKKLPFSTRSVGQNTAWKFVIRHHSAPTKSDRHRPTSSTAHAVLRMSTNDSRSTIWRPHHILSVHVRTL